METFKASDFAVQGIDSPFVQDNHSKSIYGVLRGLHYQDLPYSQGKLVRVIQGSVWDVSVDLRKDSSTYKQWFGIELTEDNFLMLYIPPGLAHGFVVLSSVAQFLYKCTAEYNRESERGIRWNDPDLNIRWPLPESDIIVSEKDAKLPFLRNIKEF